MTSNCDTLDFAHDLLPTTTIVEVSAHEFVLLAAGITINAPIRFDLSERHVGIVAVHQTFDQALSHAMAFLDREQKRADDPNDHNSPPVTPLMSHRIAGAYTHVPPPQTTITLSDLAYKNLCAWRDSKDYKGTAAHQGLGSYLLAVMTHNPLPGDWLDTRDPDIKAGDEWNAARGQLPIWAQSYSGSDTLPRMRKQRGFSQEKMDILIPLILPIAAKFMIAPYRNRLNTRTLATAFIEAYGLGYITPTHEIPTNPVPRKRDRSRKSTSVYERFHF